MDHFLELKDLEKVFYPPAIRVKTIASLAQVASIETSGPALGDKALTTPPSSSEKEGPALDKTTSSVPHSSTEGHTSQEAKKGKEPREQEKELLK